MRNPSLFKLIEHDRERQIGWLAVSAFMDMEDTRFCTLNDMLISYDRRNGGCFIDAKMEEEAGSGSLSARNKTSVDTDRRKEQSLT